MKLIKIEDYQIKIADEALLVKPFRKLWNQDRTKGKETFLKQMSIIYFMYDPARNYAYIIDEKDRLKEILFQEGISEYHSTSDFKEAADIYKRLTVTTSSELLSDIRLTINKMRQALNSVDFDSLEEKEKVSAINTVATVVAKIPKLVKDLSDAERAVAKELEEQTKTRGSQELTIGDIWEEQGI